MPLFTWLYELIIGPLELLFEVIFSQAFRIFQNPGLSIIVLSLIMNFLVLPLYKRADDMQQEERDLEARLDPWTKHIKKSFSGDERYMILQTYYRQNHYKPTYALRGSVSLLLEIPFFMAAYNMLSSLNLLNGASFGPIPNLGVPDQMLVIAGFGINLLPILMTLINLVNSCLFTKGMSTRSKVQLYAMALVFLILLYDSPAGLVFYWTLNNVFSLLKTLIGMVKKPLLLVGSLFSALGFLLLGYISFIHPMPTARAQILASIVLLALQLPLIFYFVAPRYKGKKLPDATKQDHTLFYIGCFFAAVLTGVLIPSALIKSSPEEFLNFVTLRNPVVYIFHSALLAAGFFLVWFIIFYKLANPSAKKWMTWGITCLCCIFLADYMFFGTDLGLMNSDLIYYTYPLFSVKEQLINLLAVIVIVAVIFLIYIKKPDILKAFGTAACVAVVAMSLMNLGKTYTVAAPKIRQIQDNDGIVASFPLSKHGKNVVVVMMDRAISCHIPYIFSEKPEIRQQFEGFTYYPNTMSYGAFTNVGTPPLYGGYEYTPEEMNRRDQLPLVEKHNEALKVMPVSFLQEGYQVTVCDPSYAGYNWIPDLSIYHDYPEIDTYISMQDSAGLSLPSALRKDDNFKRNLFCYGLFKAAPVFLRSPIYMDGVYNDLSVLYPDEIDEEGSQQENVKPQTIHSLTTASGLGSTFHTPYNALKNLPIMTNFEDSDNNTFLMISNDTPHEPMMLQLPQYEPAEYVDNTEYEKNHADRFILDGRQLRMEEEKQVIHYHANMASMIQLGKWLDYLRENDVYDNTRIIIVSDHGSGLGQLDDMIFGEERFEDVMFFNPVLLVKDFGSQTFSTDMQFMTQSDVPTLAFADLIENPVNPFTGKPITNEAKYQGEQHILMSYDWDTAINNGNTFLPGYWFSVKDNIFDLSNWKALPNHPLSK